MLKIFVLHAAQYDSEQLKELLRSANFEMVNVYPSLTGKEHASQSEMFAVVVNK